MQSLTDNQRPGLAKLEEGWLTVLLICALSFIAAAGVEACQWSDGLWTAWCTGILGVLTGLVLAKSAFGWKMATLIGTVYGVFFVGLFITFLVPGDWHVRSINVVVRINNFLYKLLYGGSSRDALPFPVFIASMFWLMGVVGAWALFRRHSVWPAILSNGLMLVINAYYYQGPTDLNVYLAFYVLVALILLGQTSLLLREREWRGAGVAFSPEIRLDFLRAGVVVALVGTLAAWAAPSIQASPAAANLWQQATGYWPSVRETWMRLFTNLRNFGQTSSDFYGDTLALSGPSMLSNTPIMDISVSVVREQQDTGALPTPPRYYWRAEAFERYQNGQWSLGEDNAFRETGTQEPALPLAQYLLRRDVNGVFDMRVNSASRLYVVGQPRLVSLSGNNTAIFTVLVGPDNSVDPSAVRARDILKGNSRIYRVIGSMSVADQESLRSAGTGYPEWVRSHYLQLPPEITARTRQLAQDIVNNAGARTPYDRAQAITDWLRTNITYDTQIPAPPTNREPVDWFLFTLRRGYCNYYASAEVVLLRSLGIPARLAVGFSQGDYEASPIAGEGGVYHVKEKHAHAWVEAFFPAYGWVEFEPTASEAPLVRPARAAPAVSSSGSVNPPPQPTEDLGRERDRQRGPLGPFPQLGIDWVAIGQRVVLAAGLVILVVGLGLGLLLRLGLLGWESLGTFGAWAMRYRHLQTPSPVGAIYLRLERAARWLGLPLPATLTPHERAEAVSQRVPPARPGVETITAQYVQEKYSGRPADVQSAAAAWRDIRFKVWREGLRRLMRPFPRPFKKDAEAPVQ